MDSLRSMFSILRLAAVAAFVLVAYVQALDQRCESTNFIKVVGAGKATYKNSISVVQLGVMTRGKSAMDVQKKLALMCTKIMYYLKKNQATKLQKSSVSITKRKRRSRKRRGSMKRHTGRRTGVFRRNFRRGSSGKRRMKYAWNGIQRPWMGKKGKMTRRNGRTRRGRGNRRRGMGIKHQRMGMHKRWKGRKQFMRKRGTRRHGLKTRNGRNKGTYYVERGPGGRGGTYFVKKGPYSLPQSNHHLLIDNTTSNPSGATDSGTWHISSISRSMFRPGWRNRMRKSRKSIRNPSQKYVGHMTVSFEVPINTSTKVVRGAAKHGAKIIVSMHVKASKKDAAAGREAAIANAVRTARAQAEVAAQVSKKKIIAPKTITINNFFLPHAKPVSWGARRISAASAPSVEIGESVQRVNAYVSIGYTTEELYEF